MEKQTALILFAAFITILQVASANAFGCGFCCGAGGFDDDLNDRLDGDFNGRFDCGSCGAGFGFNRAFCSGGFDDLFQGGCRGGFDCGSGDDCCRRPVKYLPIPKPFPIRVPIPRAPCRPPPSVTIPNIILALLPPNRPCCKPCCRRPCPVVVPYPVPKPCLVPTPTCCQCDCCRK